jgi:hypothetical protein
MFIEAAAELALNQSLRCRLGRAAHARARQWTWDAVFKRLYELYGETVERALAGASV